VTWATKNLPIITRPRSPSSADYLIMESTYGALHKDAGSVAKHRNS
jgi:Cft2 family RNA processing exonuclease